MRYINFGNSNLSVNSFEQERYYCDRKTNFIYCEVGESPKKYSFTNMPLLIIAIITIFVFALMIYNSWNSKPSQSMVVLLLVSLHLFGIIFGILYAKNVDKNRTESFAVEISAEELKERVSLSSVKKYVKLWKKLIAFFFFLDIIVIFGSFGSGTQKNAISCVLSLPISFLIVSLSCVGHPFSTVKKYKDLTRGGRNV